jgi:hypothetical protein
VQLTSRHVLGALSAVLAVVFTAPAAASAQTASWNDPVYGAVLPAHAYTMPVGTSVKHDVSTDPVDRASLARAGDAESLALTYADDWYTAHVGTIDPATTFAVGDTDTSLTSASPSTRTWSTWVLIYTVADPTHGYRYCESHYTTTAQLTAGDWHASATLAETVACRSISTWAPKAGSPVPLETTAYTAPVRAISKGNAGFNAMASAAMRWEQDTPSLGDYGVGVNYSMQMDADTWYVIVTVYSPMASYYCSDGWMVDFNPSPKPVGVTPSGGESCGFYGP